MKWKPWPWLLYPLLGSVLKCLCTVNHKILQAMKSEKKLNIDPHTCLYIHGNWMFTEIPWFVNFCGWLYLHCCEYVSACAQGRGYGPLIFDATLLSHTLTKYGQTIFKRPPVANVFYFLRQNKLSPACTATADGALPSTRSTTKHWDKTSSSMALLEIEKYRRWAELVLGHFLPETRGRTHLVHGTEGVKGVLTPLFQFQTL